MEWSDDAIVLSGRRLGESSLVLELLTRNHGRFPGLVRGGGSSRLRGVLQPGNAVTAQWRARLAEHLGFYSCELVRNHTARWLDDALRLNAIRSACAMAEATLPEREPHPGLHDGLLSLFDSLETEVWPAVYVRWEVELLRELGYGLDLGACAATGETADLAYVSPRTGRAVSRAAGFLYRERLLRLPAFLTGGGLDRDDVLAGLDLTAYFLRRHLFDPAGRTLPAARTRLAEAFAASSNDKPSSEEETHGC
jgi:DNA repair protein RecO (recombination protein O)